MGIGLSVGSGNYVMGIYCTILVLIVFIILPRFEERIIRKSKWDISLTMRDQPGVLSRVTSYLEEHEVIVIHINTLNSNKAEDEICLELKIKSNLYIEKIILGLRDLEGVHTVLSYGKSNDNAIKTEDNSQNKIF
ncbi:ACT domain-containing protein [Virgibacillus litoralis]|uniref:Membrane protein YhiD involved in acid resistance n=1 Tax=Virgibacillus litoralis TaxID=578221 RepID=A0ABS4HB59_9BACI|nr:ACT domain-containing protein [Virgibacillus litoralis]MBP1947879.1 putative membrane protein YhiD involved in acid resistance [Virgibacillus litoralis]